MNTKISIGIVIGIIMFGLLITPTSMATLYTIQIFVEDINGDPVPRVPVQMIKAGGVPRMETTAVNGGAIFTMEAMPGDSFTFIASKGGAENSVDWTYDGSGMTGHIIMVLDVPVVSSSGCGASVIMMISPIAILAIFFILARKFGF
jgi:hypothetical protein